MRICIFAYSGTNKKSPSGAKNTKDTIQKKLFLKVLLRLCVFVFQPKKSQPKKLMRLREFRG